MWNKRKNRVYPPGMATIAANRKPLKLIRYACPAILTLLT